MKISISTIVFQESSPDRMLEHLEYLPVDGIEVAPGMIWDQPLESTKQERTDFKESVLQYDLNVVGMHALFYNRPELQFFESKESRQRCEEHLIKMIELCSDIGGELVVFGAPKNRQRGDVALKKAMTIAADLFKKVARTAGDLGVCVCLEPLSSEYECDFITTVDEGAELVQKVDHPYFRLMLDTGSMTLNNESPVDMIEKYIHLTKHIHINDPKLSPPGARGVDHSIVAASLQKAGYQGWLTMEFLPLSSVEEDIAYAVKCYG